MAPGIWDFNKGLLFGNIGDEDSEIIPYCSNEFLQEEFYTVPPFFTWTATISMYETPIKNLHNKLNSFNEKTMNISNIAKRLFDADTKKLVKSGLLSKELKLTEEGLDELISILFMANKEEMVKRADEKITEGEQKNV